MKAFNPGDEVVLIGGKQRMAVEGTVDGKVVCVWADKRMAYAPAVLKHYERPAIGAVARGRGMVGGTHSWMGR